MSIMCVFKCMIKVSDIMNMISNEINVCINVFGFSILSLDRICDHCQRNYPFDGQVFELNPENKCVYFV